MVSISVNFASTALAYDIGSAGLVCQVTGFYQSIIASSLWNVYKVESIFFGIFFDV